MKAVSTDNRYIIYDDSLRVFDKLPAQSYKVCCSRQQGFYLEKYIEPDPKEEKIYGNHTTKVERVANAFARANRNLGVILSGAKGIGKTLFAKLLSMDCISKGMPLLVVDRYIPGIASYLESIDQECMVLFDEFDKTFGGVKQADGEANPQTEMLALFDGVANGKKLFVVTCNETRNISDFLINRPGRFHYHFRFDYPTAEEIITYLKDKLPVNQYQEIPNIVSFAGRVPLNYDCLRAIAFELSSGCTFKEAVAVLNIVNLQLERYNVVAIMKDGRKATCNNAAMDLFGDSASSCELRAPGVGNVFDVSFEAADCTYDPQHLVTIVDGENVEITFERYDEDAKDELALEWVKSIQNGIDHLEIRRCMERSIHYAV